jgi:hypothetical protein
MDEHTRDPTVAPPSGDTPPTGWDAAACRWEHATLRRALVHGVRLFNDREYHGAHDWFESVWPSVNKSYRQGTGFERPATNL